MCKDHVTGVGRGRREQCNKRGTAHGHASNKLGNKLPTFLPTDSQVPQRGPLASTPHCPPDLRHAAPRHRSRPRRRDVTWGDILPGDIYLVSPGRLAGRRPPPTPKRVSRGGRTAQPSSNTLASPTASTVPCTVTLSYYYYITVTRNTSKFPWA